MQPAPKVDLDPIYQRIGEFVVVFHAPPVWVLEAVTVACPIAAPVGSVTVPKTVAVFT